MSGIQSTLADCQEEQARRAEYLKTVLREHAEEIAEWGRNYEALQDQFNAYRRQMEPLTTDLATRLEQSLEALTDVLIDKEALAERGQYWESRALFAEGQLAPRERLRVVPREGA